MVDRSQLESYDTDLIQKIRQHTLREIEENKDLITSIERKETPSSEPEQAIKKLQAKVEGLEKDLKIIDEILAERGVDS